MPELPEVETMVRGLRPALAGRLVERIEVHDPFLLQGCDAEEFERRGRKVQVEEVVRRGKWVVITLADHRGMIVIQPRMTGGFWLVQPPRPEHIRLTFRLAKPEATIWYCDTRRLGKIQWFASPEQAALAFARSHGPDALEIGSTTWQPGFAARAGRSSRRSWIRRSWRESATSTPTRFCSPPGSTPQRTAVAALARREVDGCTGDRRGPRPWRSRPRAPASTPAIAPSSGLEGGFLAQNAMYGRAGEPCRSCGQPDREDQDRRPDRPADLFLPELPAADCAGTDDPRPSS